MSKLLRIALIVGVALVVVVVLGLLGLWFAVKRQPEWYTEQAKVNVDSPEHQEAGKEMEQGIARVVSGFEKSGKWEVVFTEAQVNAYLASVLPKKHPGLIPPELKDPRVKIEPDSLTVAARLEGAVNTVVSLKVDVYLPRPNTIAIRIRQVRAGSLPWPLGSLIEEVSNAAKRDNIPLSWTRSGEDPVAMITIAPSDSKKMTEITACQLEEGKLYLAGTTKKRSN